MTSLLAGLSFVWALAGPPVIVAGAPACPDEATVSAALSGLVPPRSDPEEQSPDVLQLGRKPDGLDVRLTDAAGVLIGQKHLAGAGSCAEKAQTIAVLVAAWETHWRPAGTLALPRAQAAEQPPQPGPPAPPLPQTVVAHRTEPPPEPLEIETRAGLLASIAGGSVAPAVTCDVGFGTSAGSFAVAVGALAVGNHDESVGPASVRWRRLGGTVDLRSRLMLQGFLLEMHAGAALTALSLSGQSLPLTSSATVFDPGLLVGLRARFPVARPLPWIEATAAIWPAAHTAYVTGTGAQRDLPSFQLLLGAGVSFGAAPKARPAEE